MTVGEVSEPGLWRFALHILMLARDNGVQLSAPSAANDALGLLGEDEQRWVMACRLVEVMLLRGKREGLVGDSSNKVRPNVVSDYHMCRGLCQHWHLAPRYASLMIHAGNICIFDDSQVTDRLLKACVRGHRWAEALHTMQQSLEGNLGNAGKTDEDCIRTDIFLHVFARIARVPEGVPCHAIPSAVTAVKARYHGYQEEGV
ncbi:hypothetical protein TraAM80_06826 [Trypanosoma rangeli]|uniref:Uncharacterized protein n=1 Tax=Trypanosoma rangeli TaxID=5698 RepID=A0A3R7MFP7_TRYRA|nr:uncharacterized protein TraAM80_06826 [Trypanosoma rangeli]RNF01658.1 hypothetical protein TraAM80_06826 [Trypanosoma rangeli]|eukprot:RNF01658.1 hypothetical protein TraAM80_06826 [Trypanosoma rangeli]